MSYSIAGNIPGFIIPNGSFCTVSPVYDCLNSSIVFIYSETLDLKHMKQILEFLKPESYLAQMLFATQLAKLGNAVVPSPSETLNSYQIPAVLRKKLDSLEFSLKII